MVSKKVIQIFRGLTFVTLSLMVLSIGLGIIAEDWKLILDENLGTRSSIIVTEQVEGEDPLLNYNFQADYANSAELVAAHKALAIKMQEEGTVLLKNSSNALPMSQGLKVTLFGMRSYYSQYGGQIGSSAPASQNVNFPTALTESGFQVNPTVQSAYQTLGEIVTGTSSGFGGVQNV